jgi:hypothetical protein
MTWAQRAKASVDAKHFQAALAEKNQGVKPLFTLGHVVATPRALAAIEKSGQQPGNFLTRHASGDWEEVPPPLWQRSFLPIDQDNMGVIL